MHFNEIDIDRDLNELNRLAFAFADKAGLEFGPLSNDDFLRRLDFACTNRWGLVIELLIEAFIVARRDGAGICTTDHFDEAFALTYGTPAGFSPFTLGDYQSGFDKENLFALLDREA